MKRLIIIGLFAIIYGSTFSQIKSLVNQNYVVAGKNMITGKSLFGIEYSFSEHIYKFYRDATSGLITIQLRGLKHNGKELVNNGKIFVFDPTESYVKWSKRIKYKYSSIVQSDHFIVQTFSDYIYCIDNATGDKLWEINGTTDLIVPKKMKALIFSSFNAKNCGEITGINLNDGKELWNKSINSENGFRDILDLNDSTVLLVASGLHAFNINNGKGWNYNGVTSINNYEIEIAMFAAGLISGLVTGIYFFPMGSYQYYGLESNTLINGNLIYFADDNNMVCFDKSTGEKRWITPLPHNMTSKSSLFIRDSLIIMINKGFLNHNNYNAKFGYPFIAAFSMIDGKQNFLSEIGDERSIVWSYETRKDTAYILCNNLLSKYSMHNGELLSNVPFVTSWKNNISYFLGDQVYIQTQDSLFKEIYEADPGKFWICNENEKIWVTGYNFVVDYQVDIKDVYVCYRSSGNYKFLLNNHKTILIDKNGRKTAELNISENSQISGTVVYDMHDNRLIKLDLKELLR
ncbi:MAG: PQQ-binding-like beta-propeller repeat protein [Bacteroidia bacterium]|nr:PQQ-binding-like beta-propeller repeat protein [Bacteroidia bacterium]